MFLNACRTDGQAPLYTTVEGWAASFLRAGAGAFIGSLWEVADTSASTYAQEFYRAALGGHTLGESARQARDAIRDNPGDPTWLAYTLYGDPAATSRAPPPAGVAEPELAMSRPATSPRFQISGCTSTLPSRSEPWVCHYY